MADKTVIEKIKDVFKHLRYKYNLTDADAEKLADAVGGSGSGSGGSGGGSGDNLFVVTAEFDAGSYYPDKTFDETYGAVMAGKQVAIKCERWNEFIFCNAIAEYEDETELIFSNTVPAVDSGVYSVRYIFYKLTDNTTGVNRAQATAV